MAPILALATAPRTGSGHATESETTAALSVRRSRAWIRVSNARVSKIARVVGSCDDLFFFENFSKNKLTSLAVLLTLASPYKNDGTMRRMSCELSDIRRNFERTIFGRVLSMAIFKDCLLETSV